MSCSFFSLHPPLLFIDQQQDWICLCVCVCVCVCACVRVCMSLLGSVIHPCVSAVCAADRAGVNVRVVSTSQCVCGYCLIWGLMCVSEKKKCDNLSVCAAFLRVCWCVCVCRRQRLIIWIMRLSEHKCHLFFQSFSLPWWHTHTHTALQANPTIFFLAETQPWIIMQLTKRTFKTRIFLIFVH